MPSEGSVFAFSSFGVFVFSPFCFWWFRVFLFKQDWALARKTQVTQKRGVSTITETVFERVSEVFVKKTWLSGKVLRMKQRSLFTVKKNEKHSLQRTWGLIAKRGGGARDRTSCSKEQSCFYVKRKVLSRGMPSFQKDSCFREHGFSMERYFAKKSKAPFKERRWKKYLHISIKKGQ